MGQRQGLTYPTRGINCLAAIGYTVPPQLLPNAVRPKASPLRLENQWPTTGSVAPKQIPAPNYNTMGLNIVEWEGRHEGKAHPQEDTLAQKEVPVLGALSDEEGGYHDKCRSDTEWYTEVAKVDQTACDDSRDEDEGILDGSDPCTIFRDRLVASTPFGNGVTHIVEGEVFESKSVS